MSGGGERFWTHILGGATRAAVQRPRAALLAALVLAAISAGSIALRLEVRSSNLDLLDPGLPEIVAFRSFAAKFGTPNMLIVALEGGETTDRDRAVALVAAALRGAPGTARVLSRPPFRDDLLAAFSLPPRFATRDGAVTYLFVQPTDVESAATTIAPFVEEVARRIAALGLERSGIRVGYTGLPRYALDDRDLIRGDISRASVLSFLGVLALFVGAFRGLRDPLLAMAVLAFAALVTAGIGAWVPGHLTLVSAFFFSILFGLGIDFGVHLLDGAEELEAGGVDRHEALTGAVARLAPGLGTGAATTTASFFVLLFSGFRGFAELGLLAGVGVVVALLAMITLLPALLVLLPPSRRRPRPLAERRSGAWLAGVQRPVLALVLATSALLLASGGPPPFDGDYLNLQAVDSEAVRIERRMVRDSDVAPQFAVFLRPDAASASRLARMLRDEPTVASVRELGDFERAAAYGTTSAEEWRAFRALYAAQDGTRAVYAFPRGDIWDGTFRSSFLEAMRSHDARVTGMPVLAELFETRSRRALRVATALAVLLLLGLVLADFGRPLRAALALLPTALAVLAMIGLQRIAGLAFNPLDLLALPVVLGVSEDAGVHLVHRFVREGGDLRRTLAGAGRSIVISGATTILGFGALSFAAHRGLASLARLLSLGIGLSLLFTLFVLPMALCAVPRRWLGLPEVSS
ncbi:MAG: MMPL family transporter [Thermoanaerobaculia bacterium]